MRHRGGVRRPRRGFDRGLKEWPPITEMRVSTGLDQCRPRAIRPGLGARRVFVESLRGNDSANGAGKLASVASALILSARSACAPYRGSVFNGLIRCDAPPPLVRRSLPARAVANGNQAGKTQTCAWRRSWGKLQAAAGRTGRRREPTVCLHAALPAGQALPPGLREIRFVAQSRAERRRRLAAVTIGPQHLPR